MKAKIELPHDLSDNDGRYLALVLAITDYCSPDAPIKIDYSKDKYHIAIEPQKEFRQSLIDNLLSMHRKLKIKITFSSSLAISELVQFSISK